MKAGIGLPARSLSLFTSATNCELGKTTKGHGAIYSTVTGRVAQETHDTSVAESAMFGCA